MPTFTSEKYPPDDDNYLKSIGFIKDTITRKAL